MMRISQNKLDRLCFVFALACLVVGCSQSSTTSGPSVNEIEQFIQENPDKIAKPEDSLVDAADEFSAGDSGGG